MRILRWFGSFIFLVALAAFVSACDEDSTTNLPESDGSVDQMVSDGGDGGEGGMAGSGGEAGMGGAGGEGGIAGAGGEGGAAGAGGEGGSAGSGGEGGMAGAGGEGGMAGAGGEGGMAGAGGEGGMAGAGGEGGMAGAGGEGGMAGAGGEGGMAGAGGEGGMAGAGGIPGQEVDYQFASESIFSALSNDAQYSDFVAVVESAQLVALLSAAPMSVFAPTNDALAAYDRAQPGSVDALLNDQASAEEFVRRHAVRGKYSRADLLSESRLTSKAGMYLSVLVEGQDLRVAGILVEGEGELASNGFAFGVPSVIALPEPRNPGTCDMPSDLAEGEIQYGNTLGAEEAIHDFTAPDAGTYCFDTLGSAFDTVLEIYSACGDPNAVVAQNNDIGVSYDDGDGPQRQSVRGFFESRATLELQAGQTVYARVTGVRRLGVTEVGDYALSVVAGPCSAVTNFDWLVRQGDYTIFIDLLTRFGLLESQLGENAGTLLAPSDSAFASLENDAPGAIADLAADGDQMFATLQYHGLPGIFSTNRLAESARLATLEGKFVELASRDSEVFVNGVLIDVSNGATDNGMVQGLEDVLGLPSSCLDVGDCEDGFECIQGQCLPPRPPGNILEELRLMGNFETFVSLIEATELELLFETVSPLTVFAPSDASFNAGEANALLADIDALYDRITYHVLRELLLAEDLVALESVNTELGQPLSIENAPVGLLVGGVVVTAPDHVAFNGTIHTVSEILTPPQVADICEMPNVIDGPGAYNGTTSGGEDGHQASMCGLGAPGPDQVFHYRSDTDRRVCFDTTGSRNAEGVPSFDSVIYVREANCADPLAEIACNDDCADQVCQLNGESQFLSAITLEAQAGVDYYIFVDGVFDNAEGDFSLQMSEGGCFEEPPMDHLLQTATTQGSANTFVQAVNAAGLQNLLNGDDQYTVFAPSDAAFTALGQEVLDGLLADPNRLREILSYHVVAGRLPASQLEGRASFMTVNGQLLHTDSRGGDIIVGGAQVSTPDVQATNGILHVVEAVMLPPAACMIDADCADATQVCGGDGFCRPAPIPGTCEDPFIIDNVGIYEGDTSDGISNESASCVGVDPATDHVYRLDAQGPFEPFPGIPMVVCLSTVGSDFDTVLHVRRDDCAGDEVACNDDTGREVQSQVELVVEENATYRVIVDGTGGATGPYLLTVGNGNCEEN